MCIRRHLIVLLSSASILLGYPAHAQSAPPGPSALAALGREIFFDTALSQPQGTSCASCHDPAHAFAGNHGGQTGVARGSLPESIGIRNTPSVLYAKFVPAHYMFLDDDALQAEPVGGLFWDGRVDTIAALTKEPLLDPLEMNAGSAQRIAEKISAAPYAGRFRQAFGNTVLSDPGKSLAAVGRAIEAFLDSPEMNPFSSKYDDYVKGKVKLSPLEQRGLQLFKDPERGNCVACHRMNTTSANPERSLFTDYRYDAVAPPRNNSIPSNADPHFFDLGLCGPKRLTPPPGNSQWCGYFRTPSLRNVAVRERFMHNGIFSSLREVISFYATRATDPAHWYGRGNRFDDVPDAYQGQININTVPYNRRSGDVPALGDSDVDAILAFLQTLTDKPFLPGRTDALAP